MNEYTVKCPLCKWEHSEQWPDGHYMGERRDAENALAKHRAVHAERLEELYRMGRK